MPLASPFQAVMIDDAWGWLLAAGSISGVLLALLGVIAVLRGWYRRTVGRRQENYRRLARLGTNAQLSFFSAVLGDPPAFRRTLIGSITTLPEEAGTRTANAAYMARIALFYRQFAEMGVGADEEGSDAEQSELSQEEQLQLVRTPVELIEAIWVDRDYYVQTLADGDETVLAFSVTTRSARFLPIFTWPPERSLLSRIPAVRNRDVNAGEFRLFRAQLGRTRFASLGEPQGLSASVGARRYHYVEAFWFGNPGAYQYFIFSSNEAGAGGWPDMRRLFPEGGGILRQGLWGEEEQGAAASSLEAVREEAVVNTYTVIGPRFQLEDYPLSFGVDADEVRVLP